MLVKRLAVPNKEMKEVHTERNFLACVSGSHCVPGDAFISQVHSSCAQVKGCGVDLVFLSFNIPPTALHTLIGGERNAH